MIIPEGYGEEVNAPKVAIPDLLMPDGTLNYDRVLAARQFHMDMVEYLGSLISLATEAAPPQPVIWSAKRPDWSYLMDGEEHRIDPRTFGLAADPLVLRNRIHAGMQHLRRKTGENWYAKIHLVENKDGSWHFIVRAYLKKDLTSDSRKPDSESG